MSVRFERQMPFVISCPLQEARLTSMNCQVLLAERWIVALCSNPARLLRGCGVGKSILRGDPVSTGTEALLPSKRNSVLYRS